MKRKWLGIALAMILLLSMTACSTSGDETGAATDAAQTDAAGETQESTRAEGNQVAQLPDYVASDYVTLDSYTGIEVEVQDGTVTDEEFDTAVNMLLEEYATTEQITDRVTEEGDTINFDYSGSVDGSYGSGTEAAVEAYQRAAGLRVTGMAGPTTQRLLYGGTSESGSYSKLDVGSTGSAVKRLQYALYELKYYDGDISGTYDTVTQNAVMVFQELNGLTIDGVAGQQTQQKLFSSNAVPCSI